MPCNGSLDKIRLDAGFFQNGSKGVGGLRIVPACQIHSRTSGQCRRGGSGVLIKVTVSPNDAVERSLSEKGGGKRRRQL